MGFSGDSVVKNPPTNSGDSGSFPESGRSPEKEMATHSRIPPSLLKGFPPGSACKESTCNVGDLVSIPGLGRSPGEGKGYPLQYSGLENSMDSPWGHKESDTTEQLSLPFLLTSQPLRQLTNLCFISVNFPTVDISYK